MTAAELFASRDTPLDRSEKTDADTRGTVVHRDLLTQASVRYIARSRSTKPHSADSAGQAGCSLIDPFRLTPAASPRRRVLVADSNVDTRNWMRDRLQAWGYQVIVAKDGAEAWNVLEEECPPELVIMDRSMPEIEGVEISRRLRHQQRDYYHYILLITEECEKRDIDHALESGADDYLVKPFGKDELKARLTAASRILSLQDNLIQARESLLDQATKDALTGVWNRPALMELFQHELDRASRIKTPTGLLILDLDHFKAVNDSYGHLAGDLALKETASRLKRSVRSYDLVGRFGGEEFLIVFPDCNREQLSKIAENIRLAVSSKPIVVGNVEIPISLSIGAVAVSPGIRPAANLIAVADVALYRAKNSGRNRSVYCDRPWQEILKSKDTHQGICASCDGGMAKTCAVPSHALAGNNQRIDPATIPNGSGLVQIPVLPVAAIAPPLAARP